MKPIVHPSNQANSLSSVIFLINQINAPTPLAQMDTRMFYEFAPLVPLNQWWHGIAVTGAFLALIWLILLIYRLDSKALPRSIAVLLVSMRILAFTGLLFFVLGPQRRSETRMTKPSELAILVDTSLSMGLADAANDSNSAGGPEGYSRRIDRVVDIFSDSPLLAELNKRHELAIYEFGDSAELEEIATVEKAGGKTNKTTTTDSWLTATQQSLAQSKRLGQFALAVLLAGLVFLGSSLVAKFFGPQRPVFNYRSLALAIACWLLVLGATLLAATDLLSSHFDLWTSLGWREPAAQLSRPVGREAGMTESPPPAASEQLEVLGQIDWQTELAPHATATKIGQALQQVVDKKRGGAAAGVLLVSDGRNNAGPPPSRAIAAASDANIPIFTLGVGSLRQPKNVRVGDLQAPARVYPGDHFQIKSMIQANGMDGQSARIQLFSVDAAEQEAETLEDEQTIRLMEEGRPTSVDFDVARQEEGRRNYMVKIIAPPGDIDPSDNQRSISVEILLRKTKVLLIGGGPTRDYQFLRNQLYRDQDITLDVWLQMAKPGADQESDSLLFDFPQSAESLFEYDCIVAFDPDWRSLSLDQARWLERWVSDKAGGMIVVAGPVFTPEWTRQPRGEESIDLIRRIYPVSFYSQGSALFKFGRFGGEKAFPLEFTREGRMAEYLGLADSLADSAANWQRFAGVFGYYAVNEPKAGADILANFSDPSTKIDDRLPIYLASHFYGAGRVLFQASGEIWRLREVDVEFFQRYYLNLIRWVSQGRLLRDSTRGVLLVDRNRCWVGDQVVVRAILRDATDAPLMVNQVTAILHRPGGVSETIELRNVQDAARPGTFSAQFLATLEGDYQIRLPVPQSAEPQELTAKVQANIPDLEKERPQRNDALLAEIAEKTGGQYFADFQPSVLTASGLPSLISPVDQEVYLPGTPDERFTRKMMGWLVAWLTLVLALEWTIRRLHRLA